MDAVEAVDLHRPGFHFTVPAGWINDPLGVTWVDGRYQLFYQLVPDGARWVPQCSWGQADGVDLVRWEHPRTALAPAGADPDPDGGCWSGAVAVADGRPTIVYTSADAANWAHGRVALAHGDPAFGGWTKAGVVVAGPPPGLGVTEFRDPFVWPVDGGWRMVVGAGLGDGSGALLQYSAPDLRDWRFDGVVATRAGDLADPVWTGAAWECPQFFELDGSWVLIVSVWAEQVTHHVAYAVGSYDGRRFTPRAWGRFAFGDSLYATTAFTDAAGRRCAISWSREAGAADRRWAGALSVPLVLRVRDDRLVARPHPDVAGLRTGPLRELAPRRLDGEPAVLAPVGPHADLELLARLPGSDDGLDVRLRQGGVEVLALAVRRGGDEVVLERPDRPAERVPLGVGADGRVELRVLLDGGIVEVFTPAGFAAVRIDPVAREGLLDLVAVLGPVELERATVTPVQRWFPA